MSKNGVGGKQEHALCRKYTIQLNPYEDSKNTNNPQSPAAHKWKKGLKNLRFWGKSGNLEYWKHLRKRNIEM